MIPSRRHCAAALLLGGLILPACGSDSDDGGRGGSGATGGAAGSGGVAGSGGAAGTSGASGASGAADAGTDAAAGYSAQILTDSAALFVGKSRLSIKVTSNADGLPAGGLAGSISLTPKMQMAAMAHGAPVPPNAVVESGTPGTYDATLFFPMASVDQDGAPLGTWTLKVGVGPDEVATSELSVKPAEHDETTHAALKNAADTIQSMGAAKPRSWMLFRDTLSATSSGHELTLFLATIQEGGMLWPPVTTGLKLVDSQGVEQLTVQSLAVQVSTDGDSWTAMSCDAAARCKAELTGLPQGSAADVLVKLAVNGSDYTTDGSAPDATKHNGFATFVVRAP